MELSKQWEDRLVSFLEQSHPGEQGKLYHNLGHTLEASGIAVNIILSLHAISKHWIPLHWIPLGRMAMLLHDIDPYRIPNTPPSVERTIQYLRQSQEVAMILKDPSLNFVFTLEQINTLILATDYSPNPEQKKILWRRFEEACREHFPNCPETASFMGLLLAYADKLATYVQQLDVAYQRTEGLAFEMRTLSQSTLPTDREILSGVRRFIQQELISSPMYSLLPKEYQQKLHEAQIFFSKL